MKSKTFKELKALAALICYSINLIKQFDNGKQLVELITSGLVPEIVLLDIYAGNERIRNSQLVKEKSSNNKNHCICDF